jgi:two-component system chemotaxis response regulator CheB
MEGGGAPIRVLVVDDSLITVQTITSILQADPSLRVVGTSLDGEHALRAAQDLRPDVITMDINMPRMDGIEATRQIVRQLGIPIVIVSAYASANSVAIQTLQALIDGAIESVQKPSGEIGIDLDLVGAELIAKVKAAAKIGSRSRDRAGVAAPPRAEPSRMRPWRSMEPAGVGLVALGVSTGGPSTLERFVPLLPGDFPAPIVLVIHMPPVFIPILASNLASRSRIAVEVARQGQVLRPGAMVIGPAGTHLTVTRDLRVRLEDGAPVNGCLPSVDVLFESIARHVPGRSLGVVLTGMGRDGARGLAAMKDKGDVTAAQDEATSVVYGMPKAAAISGAAAYEVALPDMGQFLLSCVAR